MRAMASPVPPFLQPMSEALEYRAHAKMREADGMAAPMSAKERKALYTTMADEALDEEERR